MRTSPPSTTHYTHLGRLQRKCCAPGWHTDSLTTQTRRSRKSRARQWRHISKVYDPTTWIGGGTSQFLLLPLSNVSFKAHIISLAVGNRRATQSQGKPWLQSQRITPSPKST